MEYIKQILMCVLMLLLIIKILIDMFVIQDMNATASDLRNTENALFFGECDAYHIK